MTANVPHTCMPKDLMPCQRLRSVEVFDARTGSWRMVGAMAARRAYGAAAVVEGVVYVMGGLQGTVRARLHFSLLQEVRKQCLCNAGGHDCSWRACCWVAGQVQIHVT